MKEKFEQEKQELREEIGELKVQLKLGKAEAADYIEEKKTEFSDFIDEMKHDTVGRGSKAGDTLSDLHEMFDELKLQLALGRLEGHDNYLEQREKISGTIKAIHAKWKTFGDRGKEEFSGQRESFARRAKSFETKLESAGINLGAGALLATHEVEEAVETLDSKLRKIAHMTGDEIREARNYVKSRIKANSSKSKE